MSARAARPRGRPEARPAPRGPGFDPAALTSAFEAAAHEAGSDEAALRRAAAPLVREAFERARAAARARLEAGAGGVETARFLSGAADAILNRLWTLACDRAGDVSTPTEGERLALAAVGGYGRGVLAPYSDLDLLFLRAWKASPRSEAVAEFMLYVLWDAGLKVGWASRTVDECLALARKDMTVRTALLEARRLDGDEALVETLRRRFVSEVARGTVREFVEAKLAERDARHAKAGASRYLVEPDVKEGKGGLRDLNTLFWIARYLDPEHPYGDDALKGVLTPKDWRAFEQAFDFLWRTRSWLHFAAGRAEERLTFDRQVEIAGRMGYTGRADHPAVMRFMRRYFLTAKEVGALTRAFCAKLEAMHAAAPLKLSRLLPGLRRKRVRLDDPAFRLEGDRLALADPKLFERDPVALLRLFRTADRFDLDLHPDAFAAVNRSLHLVTPKLRRDPEAARAFLDVLAGGSNPYRVLGLMNDAGLLGRFLPEFGRIVAQTQLNMHHAYTVDEHTLRAVGVIKDIELGRLAEDHPLSTAILPLIAEKEALYLAMLLHDTGKGGSRGQEDDGAIAARRACERLGLDRRTGELTAWLVRRHLVLSDYAQKRDVSDPDTVAAFARLVETPERLRLLVVLTVADVRAVGPGVWNGWKGRLMRDLFAATEAAFRGGRSSDPAQGFRLRQAALAAAARERLAETGSPEAAAWAEGMEDAYLAGAPEAEVRAHAAVALKAGARGAAAETARTSDGSATELVLAAPDRLGLFADVAETLAAHGADVVGARVHTSAAGQALDVFRLQDGAGAPFGETHPAGLRRLKKAVEAAALGAPRPAPPAPRAPGRRAAAIEITPSVSIDLESTGSAAIVEASGRDRPGLLAALARTLADAGLSIQSAHVDTFGQQAVDAFYVLEPDGSKPADRERLAAVRRALLAVLEASEKRGAAA